MLAWKPATAHHWARELKKRGHEVRLTPLRYVKPYVKRNKDDAADAEAICEAVTRPTLRFVPVKTVDQQSVLMLHRTRQLFIRQRTTLIRRYVSNAPSFRQPPAASRQPRTGIRRIVKGLRT